MSVHANASALIIAADDTASPIGDVLAGAGIPSAIAADGKQAWRLLAQRRPTHVFFQPGADDLDEFNRRLRDEFMGTPPRMLALLDADEVDPGLQYVALAAALVKPISPQALLRALQPADRVNTTHVDHSRLREMLKLTTLGAELQPGLDSVARRLLLLYGANDCAVLAIANEKQWVGSVGEPVAVEHWPQLWATWAQAADTGAPLIVTADAQANGATVAHGGVVQTRLAVPLIGPGDAPLGALCLLYQGIRSIDVDAREALIDLGTRIGTELSWRSVHERVAAERDQLRENAMLDPLMGVLSRAALEQQLAVEISRCRRSREPLTVAVIDVTGLRHINERHGHVAGDAALKHVAETTRQLVRGQDAVARYGGDEVAVLLGGTAVAGASMLLERVVHAIEADPFDTGTGVEIRVSVTAGLGEYRGEDDNGASALAAAAAAARRAKTGTGDTIVLGNRATTEAEQRVADLGPADRFEAGVTLGGMYQIVHEISRGAMGVVYRAEDLGLSRPVALKMLRPDLIRDRELVNRFRDEAAVLAALRHENLVQVYAFGEDGADVYFVMELVEGVSLEAVMHENAPKGAWMDNAKISAITEQIGGALDAMHDAGLIHRDVKPGNIVLDRARDRAVLLDVGLAMPVGAASDIAGTPGYMAPEAIRGLEPTPASDAYGLAATAYALLLQRAPFGEHDDYQATLRRQLEGPPPAPTSVRRDLPAALDPLFARALAVEPDGRFRTPGELADALSKALSDKPANTTAQWPALQALGAMPRRKAKRKGDGRPTMTLSVETVEPAASQLSRGVLFRCATRVLGMSNAVAWLSGIARKNRKLADALSPRTSALSWLPADLFIQLLQEVSASGRNAETFARELARLALADTFRRFYPSEPSKLTPQSTLSALDILWSRYHNWGRIKCDSVHQESASVLFSDGPPIVGVCSFTAGLLEKAVELSGGANPRVTHPTCAVYGEEACRFEISWTAKA